MKRFLSIVVLVAMTLHCASRLGILSFIYENRHDVLYAVGVISEKPIAVCDSNYFANKVLAINHEERHTASVLSSAQEINLFAPVQLTVLFASHPGGVADISTAYVPIHYSSPFVDIFQPPKI